MVFMALRQCGEQGYENISQLIILSQRFLNVKFFLSNTENFYFSSPVIISGMIMVIFTSSVIMHIQASPLDIFRSAPVH